MAQTISQADDRHSDTLGKVDNFGTKTCFYIVKNVKEHQSLHSKGNKTFQFVPMLHF